mmetsp:Transcript_4168/g.12908  ORF Transcript_4168/g.12908 Transcript_4168/m.12908 type:complete len:295 (-) Transcript_4168:1113-1997(-)
MSTRFQEERDGACERRRLRCRHLLQPRRPRLTVGAGAGLLEQLVKPRHRLRPLASGQIHQLHLERARVTGPRAAWLAERKRVQRCKHAERLVTSHPRRRLSSPSCPCSQPRGSRLIVGRKHRCAHAPRLSPAVLGCGRRARASGRFVGRGIHYVLHHNLPHGRLDHTRRHRRLEPPAGGVRVGGRRTHAAQIEDVLGTPGVLWAGVEHQPPPVVKDARIIGRKADGARGCRARRQRAFAVPEPEAAAAGHGSGRGERRVARSVHPLKGESGAAAIVHSHLPHIGLALPRLKGER